jgi:hypothetical protein
MLPPDTGAFQSSKNQPDPGVCLGPIASTDSAAFRC